MNPQRHLKFWFSLRVSVILWVVIMGGLLLAFQYFGPIIGLTRHAGMWIWAAIGICLNAALFGPYLAERMGVRRTLLFGGLLLAGGAAVFLYVTEIMLPAAVERAARARQQPSR